MQPETIFIGALVVAVVVIVLAIRKARRQRESLGDVIDLVVGDVNWPDWW